MKDNEFVIDREYIPFSIVYEPAIFGWFLLSKSVKNILPDGGYWYWHSVFYALRFILLLIPAFIIDIATSGSIFLLKHLFVWLLGTSKKIVQKSVVALVKTVLRIIGKIAIISFVVIFFISLYTDFETWKNLSKLLSKFVSQLF